MSYVLKRGGGYVIRYLMTKDASSTNGLVLFLCLLDLGIVTAMMCHSSVLLL